MVRLAKSLYYYRIYWYSNGIFSGWILYVRGRPRGFHHRRQLHV